MVVKDDPPIKDWCALRVAVGFLTSNNYAAVYRAVQGLSTDINGQSISDNFEVHHCFPQAIFCEGGVGEKFIKETGININNPRLLVWWNKSEHKKDISNYNEFIEGLLTDGNLSNKQIIDKIRKYNEDIGFKVLF